MGGCLEKLALEARGRRGKVAFGMEIRTELVHEAIDARTGQRILLNEDGSARGPR